MSAKKTFRRIDIDAVLKDMLNAPEIPEEDRELSREEALRVMSDGFRRLLIQGYTVKGILEYLKKKDCPVKDIKQGEISSLIQSAERSMPVKRKNKHLVEKTESGNIPELNETIMHESSSRLKKTSATQREDKKKLKHFVENETIQLEKGSFSLNDDLPLDEI